MSAPGRNEALVPLIWSGSSLSPAFANRYSEKSAGTAKDTGVLSRSKSPAATVIVTFRSAARQATVDNARKKEERRCITLLFAVSAGESRAESAPRREWPSQTIFPKACQLRAD